MATLAFAAAGAAVGSALLPAGVSFLGATLTGATIGAQVGALAGSYVDATLFGVSGQNRSFEGPRLSELRVTASTEGAPIPRLYGRARLGGQVIWAADYEETVTTEQSGGGKGAPAASGERITYAYFASFAVAIAEGTISGLGRIWADGRELDLTGVEYRLYTGDDHQLPDSLIEASEGAAATPAYRGVAYIVLERLPLAEFGNRLPQLSFEVHRAVDDFADAIRGVVLIPGSGEFVYANEPVTRTGVGSEQIPENVHTRLAATDWAASLDQLETELPNARAASLVVSWFGSDLRAPLCSIRPKVERSTKVTRPLSWSVAGLTRATAQAVSSDDNDRPAYGGTPSDQTVIDAIDDLKSRGLAVTLNPFLLLDVPADNALTDPHTGATSQPAFPWRGRITLDPAPGQPGSPDKTAIAATQIAAFVGTAAPSDFAILRATPEAPATISYSGPDEWSYRRFILHCAALAKSAGGVDAFLIGSELRSLTQTRDGGASYPFVAALTALAADVKAMLGPGTKITYAADWSEYFGHQPADGSGDLHFHLDSLWAFPAIDAIGIDLYWPLADWRDGDDHLDASVARSPYDLAYLKANLTTGEGFDWYYASPTDRADQVRTPITDGLGKPWVYRYKDLRSWWLNQHYDRQGGIESTTPTGWLPQSKPFWLMEIGCPAVDKGANQPNVFIDPKSVESALPHFSNGRRDDLMQRRLIQAIVEAFDPTHPDYVPDLNPVSVHYSAPMVDPDRIHVYAWDTRPYPAFPADTETWSDAANWRTGHWLNGRTAAVPLAELVRQLIADFGHTTVDPSELVGIVPGFVVDRIMSAREALQPLELAYFFDSIETGTGIRLTPRGLQPPALTFTPANLVETRPEAALHSLVRTQETDLPASAKLAYIEAAGDYRNAIAEARRVTCRSNRVAQAEVALMLDAEHAEAIASSWLYETWASRERASFTLPPSRLALEPGDIVRLDSGGVTRPLRITETGDGTARAIEARSIDREVYRLRAGPGRQSQPITPPAIGPADAVFLDLPLLTGAEPETAGYVAISQVPWPGAFAIYSSPEQSGFALAGYATSPATVGFTLDDLPAGPVSRIDHAHRPRVALDRGALTSISSLALLSGANAAALVHPDGTIEVFQFQNASLIAPLTYELSGLLRGQSGTEPATIATLPAGARFVLIDSTLARLDLAADRLDLPFNWRYGPSRRNLGHASYGEAVHTFLGIGRRPLSPVHVRATRSAGDLLISWVRRTRRDGDSWSTTEVRLAEESEAYEVDILDGPSTIRTIAASAPAAAYSAADQIGDFGSLPALVSVRIHQLSTTFGRGPGATATL